MDRTHRRINSGTPFSSTSNGAADGGEEGEDSELPRRTRSRLGPLPKNGPDNPLFPPLPPKVPKPPKSSSRSSMGRGTSQSGGSRSNSMRRDELEEGEIEADDAVKEEPAEAQQEAPLDGDGEASAAKQEDEASDERLETTGAKDATADEWETYARERRRARGFGTGSSSARSRSSHSEKQTEAVEKGGEVEADERKVTPAPAPEDEGPSGDAATGDDEPSKDKDDEPSTGEAETEAAPDADESTSTTGRATRSLRRSSKIDAPRPTSATMAPAGAGADSTGSLSALAEDDHDAEAEVEADEEGDVGDEEDEEEEDGEENADVTRCICGKEAENDSAMMISCDQCNVWQHGPCVGIYSDDEAPDEYFCELCRPALHVCLKRYLKNLQKKGIHGFRAPSPQDLDNVHQASDRVKPSQSLRWRPGFKAPPASQSQSSRNSTRNSTRKESPPPSATGSDSRRASSRPSRSAQVQDSRYEPHGVGADRKKRPPIERRESSVLSETPPPPGSAQAQAAAKKRSTMNSRDAAYELAIAASLAEGGELGPRGIKRARTEEHDDETEEAQAKKGKKPARETTAPVNAESDVVKPKHPNQYTYRPKPGDKAKEDVAKKAVTASPSKRSAVPVEALPSSRRAGVSSARGGTPSGLNPFVNPLAVQNITWGMPDHLQQFAHLLPTPQPVPLEVVTPRPPKAFNLDMMAAGVRPTHLEPPTRVRFPTKRMTVSEMRKRVRNVLEFVGRLQVEEVNRIERATILGIQPADPPSSRDEPGREAEPEAKAETEPNADVDMDAEPKDESAVESAPLKTDASVEPAAPDASEPPKSASSTGSSNSGNTTSKSMHLMDELTRDLIRFQEMFEPGYMGAGRANGLEAEA